MTDVDRDQVDSNEVQDENSTKRGSVGQAVAERGAEQQSGNKRDEDDPYARYRPVAHHGNTRAAWTGSMIAGVGFLLATVGFVLPDGINWLIAGIGFAIVLAGVIAGGVLRSMGYGTREL